MHSFKVKGKKIDLVFVQQMVRMSAMLRSWFSRYGYNNAKYLTSERMRKTQCYSLSFLFLLLINLSIWP